MKRICILALLLGSSLVATTALAQQKTATTPAATPSVHKLMEQYRWSEARTLLEGELASLKRLKKPTTQVEADLRQVQRAQAEKLAEYKSFQFGGKPILNAFEFDEKALSDESLKVLQFDGYSKEWANFVFANRNSEDGESVHDYDIVVGPIANDRVGVQVRRYIEREISLETFLENLKYMKGITFQYFFGTEKAIRLLRKI